MQTRRSTSLAWRVLPLLAVLLVTLIGRPDAQAAPLAGTSIGNQASATYTDASAIGRTATSNTVSTVVQQVASFTLTADQTRTVSPGNTVYFPHTLTNTGNGSDTFALSAVDANTGSVNFSSIVMFVDADGNGVPDNGTPIASTGALAPNGVFRFVVAAVVPGTTTTPSSETITVTGTSAFDSSTESNTDTVNVTGNAVINITKALSISPGPSPSAGNILVTLTYSNTGNSTATDVTISDVIGVGATAGMTYITSETAGFRPTWSGGGTLTDTNGAADDSSAGIDYSYDSGSNTITAVIASIAPTVSGTLRFYISIDGGLAPGTAVTNNRAAYEYDDGSGSTITGQFTNFAAYNVLQTAGVVANGSAASSANGTGEPVTVASAAQGATVSFDNYIWNTGNGTDSFNVTVDTAGSTFPAGTTFQLFQDNGVAPLVGGNTGDIAPGGYYKVVLKATLPAGVSGNNGGAGFSVTKTATSVADPTKSDTVIDHLDAISANVVDLTNNFAAGNASCDDAADNCGFGFSTGEALPQTTVSVNPGAAASFTLYVNNISGVADTYNLFADDDNTWTSPATNDLPAGWTVTFNSGTCAAPGGVITNTGVVNVGSAAAVCATISVPAGTIAGDTAIFFRAVSPTTNAVDTKHDQVTVNAVRALAITADNSGQIFPGGTIVYPHILTNNGNVVEGNGTVSSITLGLADTLAGWTSVVYFDVDNNGTLDVTDPIVNLSLNNYGGALADGLAPAESVRFFVRVTAPLGANIGDINQTTITATTANGTYTTTVPAAVANQDTTQVIAGQVRLVKTQALDAGCDGAADTAFGQGVITTGAVPGACIRYQIVATNDGTANVTSLVVNDATPANTTYDDGSRNSAGGACSAAVDAAAAIAGSGSVNSISAPLCNASGTISANVGTLAPGATATMTFGVMINP